MTTITIITMTMTYSNDYSTIIITNTFDVLVRAVY